MPALLRPSCLTGTVVLVTLLAVISAPPAQAQYPLARSSTLLAFDGYHDYQATVAFMDHYARTYPDIVEKFTIGKSYLGTDVHGLIITNKKTGPHTEKSAYWADGNRHSGEVTGGEAVLYTIKYLCENYGKDPVVTGIVDTKVAYLVPKMNPDGSDVYLHTPGTLRSTVRPYDQDRDGQADEDPADDLDGDGQSTSEERERFIASLPAPYTNQPWTKATHPTLGEVEVGGNNSKFPSQNPPPSLLVEEIHKNVLWAVRKMEWMPLMRVAETKVEKVAGQEGVYKVTASFVNEGRLPTALEMAKTIHIVQEDYAEITLPEGMGLVDAQGQPLRRGGFGGRGGRGGMGMMGMRGEPQGARNRTLTVTGGSTRGGVHRVEVTLPR